MTTTTTLPNTEQFSFNQYHINTYLASKADDEVIGQCMNPLGCLVARALEYHYPAYSWFVSPVGATGLMHLSGKDDQEGLAICMDIRFSPSIVYQIEHFDDMGTSSNDLITKRQWLDSLGVTR